MSNVSQPMPAAASLATSPGVVLRTAVIGTMAFLTVVDLFATQAILPTLTRHYGVSPAAMGLAVNSSTIGMAIASLGVGLMGQRVDRRTGIVLSLVLLAIPTLLLAIAPTLAVFAGLRIAQGLCMAAAFALTLAHLGEECSATDAGLAFAAYITGNVASNLFGRLISAAVADHFGVAANFAFFAGLNLAGAGLAYATINRAKPATVAGMATPSMAAAWRDHLRNPPLRATFGIGFCILFAFIGTFTFVNFVLVREPFMLSRMQLGFVYFVFLPSIVTTLMAGAVAGRIGTRPAMWTALAIAMIGLPLLLSPELPLVLTGMVLVAVGTFLAQAIATGFLGKAAMHGRSAASGMYLSSYFSGGLVGTAVLGLLFDRFGWIACAAGIGVSLCVAAFLTSRLEPTQASSSQV
jgi:MFS transporter, YNFM family, putative membrane transport protein